jgi:hypothetical protein
MIFQIIATEQSSNRILLLSPKRRFIYRLHVAISQKMEILITTAVRIFDRKRTEEIGKDSIQNSNSTLFMKLISLNRSLRVKECSRVGSETCSFNDTIVILSQI